MKRIERRDSVADIGSPPMGAGGDPGLRALREAEIRYRGLQGELAAAREDLLRLERQARLSRVETHTLERRLTLSEAALAGERTRLEQAEERAERLAAARHRLHHELYGGVTTQALLQAALHVTGATRGCYVSVADFHVLATIGVEVETGASPPAAVLRICREVALSGGPALGTAITSAVRAREAALHDAMAALVAVRGVPHGILVVLDGTDGSFDPDDVGMLQAIGADGGVAIENAELRDQVQQAFFATLELLADMIEASDRYTRGHCSQVVRYACATARLMDLDDESLRTTCYAALLHDIGKIGVSDGVLNKPGPLLPSERALIQSHVRIGHDLLRSVPALGRVADAVLRHHEWYDGNGYPDGLAGDRIPLPARIVAVADAYCAMRDHRAYKEAFPRDVALDELRRCAGTQFDPDVVVAMLDAVDAVDAGLDQQEGRCGLPPGVAGPAPLQASA